MLWMVLLAMSLWDCSSASSRPAVWAYIDQSGTIQIPSEFESAQEFSEGLAAVMVHGKWGYINNTGRLVISPQYGSASSFSDGLAVVTSTPSEGYWEPGTLFGYIGKLGTLVIPERFNWARPFSEGLAEVCIGPCRNRDLKLARKGYINKNGDFVIPLQFSRSGPFSEGLAAVSLDRTDNLYERRHGFINRLGQFLIEPQFAWAHPFSQGLAATDQGYIDRSGKLAIVAQPDRRAGDFAEGLALVRTTAGIAFIDSNGKALLELQGWSVGSFSQGLAAACNGDCGPSSSGQNWGYVNKRGIGVCT